MAATLVAWTATTQCGADMGVGVAAVAVDEGEHAGAPERGEAPEAARRAAAAPRLLAADPWPRRFAAPRAQPPQPPAPPHARRVAPDPRAP
eukprot:1051966-Rhodomonas_salina.8